MKINPFHPTYKVPISEVLVELMKMILEKFGNGYTSRKGTSGLYTIWTKTENCVLVEPYLIDIGKNKDGSLHAFLFSFNRIDKYFEIGTEEVLGIDVEKYIDGVVLDIQK